MIAILITCLHAFLAPAHALQNFHTIRDEWQLELTHQGFFSDANYNEVGDVQALAPSHNYRHFLVQLDTSYNLTEEVSIFGSIGGATAQSADGNVTRTNTAATDFGLGVQYLFQSDFFWVGPEIFVSNPISTIDQNTDQVLVNEGVTQITGKLNILKVWSRVFQSFGYIGYTYSLNGRASVVPWSVASRLRIVRPWIGLEVSGYQTAIADSETESYRRFVTDRVDAGSQRFYSVAPSLIQVAGLLEMPWSGTVVTRLEGGTTVAGGSTAQGVFYQLALNYTFGGSAESTDYFNISNQYRQQRLRDEQKLRKFRVRKDEENQDLFHEEE